MALLKLLSIATFISLSHTLLTSISPIKPPTPQLTHNPPTPFSPDTNPLHPSNPPTNKTTPSPSPPHPLTLWPPLPFTIDTGHHLNLTITSLGPPTPPHLRLPILNSINALYDTISREGPPDGNIDGVYARSSGVVWVLFGCEVGRGCMKRFEVVQVVGKVWFLMLDYGPREVRGAEVRREGVVAGFGMRFF